MSTYYRKTDPFKGLTKEQCADICYRQVDPIDSFNEFIDLIGNYEEIKEIRKIPNTYIEKDNEQSGEIFTKESLPTDKDIGDGHNIKDTKKPTQYGNPGIDIVGNKEGYDDMPFKVITRGYSTNYLEAGVEEFYKEKEERSKDITLTTLTI